MFKPSGGRMGESDMDYDQDEKSMAALRRRLRKAHSAYYRYKRYFGKTLSDSVMSITKGWFLDWR